MLRELFEYSENEVYIAHISKVHLIHSSIMQVLGKISLKFQCGILVVINIIIEHEAQNLLRKQFLCTLTNFTYKKKVRRNIQPQ
jgi:hypothetical protein